MTCPIGKDLLGWVRVVQVSNRETGPRVARRDMGQDQLQPLFDWVLVHARPRLAHTALRRMLEPELGNLAGGPADFALATFEIGVTSVGDLALRRWRCTLADSALYAALAAAPLPTLAAAYGCGASWEQTAAAAAAAAADDPPPALAFLRRAVRWRESVTFRTAPEGGLVAAADEAARALVEEAVPLLWCSLEPREGKVATPYAAEARPPLHRAVLPPVRPRPSTPQRPSPARHNTPASRPSRVPLGVVPPRDPVWSSPRCGSAPLRGPPRPLSQVGAELEAALHTLWRSPAEQAATVALPAGREVALLRPHFPLARPVVAVERAAGREGAGTARGDRSVQRVEGSLPQVRPSPGGGAARIAVCRRESGEHRFAEESIRLGGENEGAEEEGGGGEAEAEAVLQAEACHVLLGSRLALLSEAAAPHPDPEDCCE